MHSAISAPSLEFQARLGLLYKSQGLQKHRIVSAMHIYIGHMYRLSNVFAAETQCLHHALTTIQSWSFPC